MTESEAKAILAAGYRADPDNPDPRLAEALQLARTNPSLSAWLDGEKAFDEAFSSRLEALEPPPDLKERLLGLERTVQTATETDQEDHRTFQAWWARPSTLSLAAGLVLLLALSFLLFEPQGLKADASAQDFIRSMVSHAESDPRVEHGHEDFRELTQYLQTHRRPLPHPDTHLLGGPGTHGVIAHQWGDHPVGVIVFQGADKSHLYVIHMRAFGGSDEGVSAQPTLAEWDSTITIAWVQDDHLHLLVTSGPDPRLPKGF